MTDVFIIGVGVGFSVGLLVAGWTALFVRVQTNRIWQRHIDELIAEITPDETPHTTESESVG